MQQSQDNETTREETMQAFTQMQKKFDSLMDLCSNEMDRFREIENRHQQMHTFPLQSNGLLNQMQPNGNNMNNNFNFDDLPSVHTTDSILLNQNIMNNNNNTGSMVNGNNMMQH